MPSSVIHDDHHHRSLGGVGFGDAIQLNMVAVVVVGQYVMQVYIDW